MFVIDDILIAPLKPLIWLGRKIDEIMEEELSDEGRIKEKLMELQLRFELDEMVEEEYEAQERELLVHLEAIRKAREGV